MKKKIELLKIQKELAREKGIWEDKKYKRILTISLCIGTMFIIFAIVVVKGGGL